MLDSLFFSNIWCLFPHNSRNTRNTRLSITSSRLDRRSISKSIRSPDPGHNTKLLWVNRFTDRFTTDSQTDLQKDLQKDLQQIYKQIYKKYKMFRNEILTTYKTKNKKRKNVQKSEKSVKKTKYHIPACQVGLGYTLQMGLGEIELVK